MAGRKPAICPNNSIQHQSNSELQERESKTPVYQSQKFKAPKSLTEPEKKVWKWLVAVFKETINCRASDADVHLMEIYCRAKVAMDEADAALKEDPQPYIPYECGTDKDGNPKYQLKANPNIKKRNENAALCIRLFDQLGLSPLARARAGLSAANAKNKNDALMKLMNRSDG